MSNRPFVTEMGKRDFLGFYSIFNAEIFSEDSYDLCAFSLYIILSVGHVGNDMRVNTRGIDLHDYF